MTPKALLAASLLFALALAGCTGGGGDGGGTSTSTSGTGSVGGCVTANGSGACANATASGSATMTSTSMSNTTTGGNGTGNATMERTVRIENGAFSPAEVTVRVGGTVTWEHHDGATMHTVTADDGSFDSHPACNPPALPINDCMTEGEEFTFTFTAAGEYPYHDKLDDGLTGVVRVVEA